ncbi:hypothetical protein LKR43_05115 [Pusillimonas sp. MFBS29]|uniref:hypothetical protein n=1 Tax=Pusillimonas sp. MFBS29 TaxID=2886690 RepID=UPI001D113142|nr:hypothetical protein [Pusillimonas sp. MFBS29]MCC2595714.1 hypothetical protein [Pusillimonas sp. MFBS29]
MKLNRAIVASCIAACSLVLTAHAAPPEGKGQGNGASSPGKSRNGGKGNPHASGNPGKGNSGTDLILISVATAVVADILYDVFD